MHSAIHAIPVKPTTEKFGREEFVAQEILDSGFTTIPKYSVTDQGNTYNIASSEFKTAYGGKNVLKSSKFDKSKIKPSSSAYTTDIAHISIESKQKVFFGFI
jgi:hypothetical protein